MHILRALSILIAILTGLITIYGFAVEQGWLTSGAVQQLSSLMSKAFPEDFIGRSESIRVIIKSTWPLGVVSTALIIVALVSSIMIFFERTLLFDEYFLSMLLFMPLPLAWAWLFFDEVSVMDAGALGVLYFASPYVLDLAFFSLRDYLERRQLKTVCGSVRDIQQTRQSLAGFHKTTIQFIVDQPRDIPIKARYSYLQEGSRKVLPREGDKVTLSGRWNEGIFEVDEVGGFCEHQKIAEQ
jgi:hypothetical protein